MDLPSIFSSVTPPWGTGKWLSAWAEHPYSPRAVGQRVKARLLFYVIVFFFPQSNVDIHLLISEHFNLD